MTYLTDTYGRNHTYLRISLTDKCNLHCTYCNPLSAHAPVNNSDALLTYDELLRMVGLLVVEHGITKIRITGGEPLIRKDVMYFFRELSALKKRHPFTLGITTNGTMLFEYAQQLRRYSVDTLNISLDSLEQNTFRRITHSDSLHTVLDAIRYAQQLEFSGVKVNMVVMRGINDHEVLDFTEFAIQNKINVRFIEFMPFTKNDWSANRFIPYLETKELIESRYSLSPITGSEHDVSKDFYIQGTDGMISFISSVSEHFCGGCNRLRITANGLLKTCLFSDATMEVQLKDILRSSHYDDTALTQVIRNALNNKWKQHPGPDVLASMKDNAMLAIGG